MYHFVYKTTNLVNGKSYIGKHSTKNLSDGYLGSGLVIMRAVDKYGSKNFKREILEFCSTLDEAYSREECIITDFDAVNSELFYNMTAGGKGNKGYVPIFTEEWKRKISESLKGKILTKEHRDNVSKGCKGREVWNTGKTGIYTKEVRNNISDGLKKYFKENGVSEETRLKLSKAGKGRVSPMKGRINTEESNIKRSNKLKGRVFSVETIKLLSLSSKGVKKEIVKCPYCEIQGGIGVMKRWHFSNCKNKNNCGR